jgi:uncharacterized protein
MIYWRAATAFLAGILFALGLSLSGMTDPNRILAFLDILGDWDGSLLAVMAGAVVMYRIGYTLVRARSRPVLDDEFHIAEGTPIDRPLLWGAAIFGIGWGLVGFCPGPALATLFYGGTTSITFVIAMSAGMFVYHRWFRPKYID